MTGRADDDVRLDEKRDADSRSVPTAIRLMRLALALLVTQDRTSAAMRLRQAIDEAERKPVGPLGEEDELLRDAACRTGQI